MSDSIVDLKDTKHRELFINSLFLFDIIGVRLRQYISKLLKPSIKCQKAGQSFISGAVEIAESTFIDNACTIRGPAIIGNNCRIGPNVFIGENVILEDNVVIGFACELKNCVIMSGVQTESYCTIENSIVENYAYINRGLNVFSKHIKGGTVLNVVD